MPQLEFKSVGTDIPPALAGTEPEQGIVEALVAITGIKDEVGDIITPGAFARTLRERRPKVCLGHDWNRPVGKTLTIKELLPGDPGLPKKTADGKPWPAEAGGVLARALFNLDEPDGMRAYRMTKFYGADEQSWSIGYKVVPDKTRKVGDTRHIGELDLFEYSPVLHPASRLALTQMIKDGASADVEVANGPDLETKVRKVKDSSYWGYPVGTPITANMKPRGKAALRLRAEGKKPSRAVGTDESVKPGTGEKPKPIGARSSDTQRQGQADEAGLFPEPAPDKTARLRATKPKGKDDEHVNALVEQEDDQRPEAAQARDAAMAGLLEEGITPDELREDLDAADWPDSLTPEQRQELIDEHVADYQLRYRRAVRAQQREGGDDSGTVPDGTGQEGDTSATPDGEPAGQGAEPGAGDGPPESGPDGTGTPDGEPEPTAPDGTPLSQLDEGALETELLAARQQYADVRKRNAKPGVKPNRKAETAAHERMMNAEHESNRRQDATGEGDAEEGAAPPETPKLTADGAKAVAAENGLKPVTSTVFDQKFGAGSFIAVNDSTPVAIWRADDAGFYTSGSPRALKIEPSELGPFTQKLQDGGLAAQQLGVPEQILAAMRGGGPGAPGGNAAPEFNAARVANGISAGRLENLDGLDAEQLAAVDEEMTRRAGLLGTPDGVTKAHQVVKDRLEAARQVEPEPTGEPDGGLGPSEAEISREEIDNAEAAANEAMGLFEGPDGELEAAPDVADRQDRVEALLAKADREGLALGELDDGTLASQRQDLVNELRLQEAVARRDARKRREGGGGTPPPPGGGDGGEEGGSGGGGGGGTGPTITKATVRPGVSGAAEDLAEALEGDDEQKLTDATARLESSLRRSSSDSEHVQALRTAVAKHGSLKAAIDAGDVTPESLRKFAEDLRAERREQRNRKARDRRTVKRLERDRIRSLIGGYDSEMRRRNMDPDRFGGAVPPSSGPSSPGEPGVPDEPTPDEVGGPSYPDTDGGRAATQLREQPWRMIDTGSGWDPQPDEEPGDDRALRRQAATAAYSSVAREWGWVLADASDNEIALSRDRVNKFLDQRGTSIEDIGEMMVIADLLPANQKPYFRDAVSDATTNYSRNLIALREARDRGALPDAGRPTLGAASPDRVGPAGRLNALAPRPRGQAPLSSTGTPPFTSPGEVKAHLKDLQPPPGLADYQLRSWENDRDDLVRMIDAAGGEAYVSPGGGLLTFKGDTSDGKRWFLISTMTGESIPSLFARRGVSVQPQLRPETSSAMPFTRYDLDGPAMRRLMNAMESTKDGSGRQVDFTNPDRKSLIESMMGWRDFSGDGVLRPASPDGGEYRYGDNLEAAAILEAVREDLGRYAGTAALSRALEAVRRDRDGINGRSGQQVRQLGDQFMFALSDFNFGRKRKTGAAENRDREQLKQDKVTGLTVAHAKALTITGNPADAVALLRMRAAEVRPDDDARGARFGSARLEGLANSIKEQYSPAETEMARLLDSEEGDYLASTGAADSPPSVFKFTVAPQLVTRRADGTEVWQGTVADGDGHERSITIDTGDQYGIRIPPEDGGFNVDSYSQNATNSWAAFRAADGQGEPQSNEEVRAASQRQVRAFEAQFGGGDDGGGDPGDDGGGPDQGPDGGPGPSGGERPVAAEGKSITAADIKGGELVALGDDSRPGGQLTGHVLSVRRTEDPGDDTVTVSLLADDGVLTVVPLAPGAGLTRLDFTDQDMIDRMPEFDGPVIPLGTASAIADLPLGSPVQIMTGSDGDPNYPRRRLAMGEVELGPDGPLLRTTDGRLLSVDQIIESDDHPYSHPMVEVPFPSEITATEDRYPDTAKDVKVAPGDRVQAFVSVDIPGEYSTGRWLDGWVETVDPDRRNVQVRLPGGELLNIDTNEGEPGASRMLRRKGGPTKATQDAVDTRDVARQSYQQYVGQGGNAGLAVSALRTRVLELVDSTRDNRPNASEGIAPRSLQLRILADGIRDADPEMEGFLPTVAGRMVPGKLLAAFGGNNDPGNYALDFTEISPEARTAAVEFYRDYVATMLERAAASAEEFERIDDSDPDRLDNRVMGAVRRAVEGSPTTQRLGRQLSAALAEAQLKQRASLPDDDPKVSVPAAKRAALEKAVLRERWNQYKRIVSALAMDGHRISAPSGDIEAKWDRDAFDSIARGIEKELRDVVGDDDQKFRAISGDIARSIQENVLRDIRDRKTITQQHSRILDLPPGRRLALPKAGMSGALDKSLEEALGSGNGVKADPSKPLAARVAALRQQLGPHGFGLTGVNRYEIVGGVGLAPAGRVELNEVTDTRADVAPDGGPGRKTLRDLSVLRAIGNEIRTEAARLHSERLNGPEMQALRDEDEKAQAEAANLRPGYANGLELTEVLTGEVMKMARADGKEANSNRVLMLVKALVADDWQDKLAKRTKIAPDMVGYVHQIQREQQGMIDRAREDRQKYEAALERSAAATLARNRFEKNALSEARLEALSQIREFGGNGNLKWATGELDDLSGKDLNTLQKHVARHYPSDWIATAGELEVGQYEPRGYYNHASEKINIGMNPEGSATRDSDPVSKYGRVSLHEQGHHFEKTVPGLLRAEWAFHYSRTSFGPYGERKREAIRKMRNVTGISSYGDDEVTIPDNFPEPYSGKIYSENGDHRTRSWELFTTGVESLFAGSRYLDDDFESWMLGTMAGV